MSGNECTRGGYESPGRRIVQDSRILASGTQESLAGWMVRIADYVTRTTPSAIEQEMSRYVSLHHPDQYGA